MNNQHETHQTQPEVTSQYLLGVGVGDEVPPDLRVGDSGVRLGGRRERCDLHVEVVVQVHVLRLRRVAKGY